MRETYDYKLKPTLKIVNVVTSTKVFPCISIEKLAISLPHVIYEPETFSGLIYRQIFPKSTIIMFASGKITSTGCPSVNSSKKSISSIIFEIEKVMKTSLTQTAISIENIVGVSYISKKIDLKTLSKYSSAISYDKDRFAGAICTINKMKALIFSTGKIILVGAKTENELSLTNKMVLHLLKDTHSV